MSRTQVIRSDNGRLATVAQALVEALTTLRLGAAHDDQGAEPLSRSEISWRQKRFIGLVASPQVVAPIVLSLARKTTSPLGAIRQLPPARIGVIEQVPVQAVRDHGRNYHMWEALP